MPEFKDMSAFNETTGGALVSPPAQGRRFSVQHRRKVLAPRTKSIEDYADKAGEWREFSVHIEDVISAEQDARRSGLTFAFAGGPLNVRIGGRDPALGRFVQRWTGKSLNYHIKAQSHTGEPCKRGWSAARTGCTPKQKPQTSSETPRRGRKPRYTEEEGKKIAGEVYSKINSLLSGKEEITSEHVNDVKDRLLKMNVADIVNVKRKLGLKASGNKKELADKIAARALGVDYERGGAGGARAGESLEDYRSRMAEATRGTDHPAGDPGWAATNQPAGEKPYQRIPRQIEHVNKRLDRYANTFRQKGQWEQADWMDQLKNHINTVGVETALEQLGPEVEGETKKEEVAYAGARADISDFATKYLDRIGISILPEGGTSNLPVVSSAASSSDEEGWKKVKTEDVFPRLQTFKDKLEEAQHLPGLERSQDLGEFMGGKRGDEVTNFAPEMVSKLDAEFGKDGWIVKSYDDAAYAGFGIFFPQKARQVQKDAQNTLWSAGENLSRHGFSLMRDEGNRVVGIKHQNGDEYPFGKAVEEEDDQGRSRINYPEFAQGGKLYGDVLDWGLKAAGAAPSEHGASLPRRWLDSPTRYMVQPAFPAVGISEEERARGVTFKGGTEGRVHIVTKNGKAEIVPHATWLKGDPPYPLPVVFEDEHTRAMAQAALEAINALPESERQGQMYGPDVMLTGDGYKVIEANPANEAGASGYTQDNPFVMDAYVSQLMNREPAHVRFIRDLLAKKGKTDDKDPNGASGRGRREGSETRGGAVATNDTRRAEGGYRPPKESPETTERYKKIASGIQKKRAAQETMMNAHQRLGKYGFDIAYDDAGRATGIEHENGDFYGFGTPEYDQVIHGDARHWADEASRASPIADGPVAGSGKGMGDRRAVQRNARPPQEAAKQLSKVGNLSASGADGKRVLDTAKKSGMYIPPERLPFLADDTDNVGGYEHDVYQDADNNTYYKLTANGKFGHGAKGTNEYLLRHEIANDLWPSLGYSFHGVTEDHRGQPQVIMSMNRIAGEHPPQNDITAWFREKGWEPVGWDGDRGNDDNIRSWKDPESGTVIHDAHSGNFIKNDAGLVPIDVDIVPGNTKKRQGM